MIDNITYGMDETNYAILNHYKQSVQISEPEPKASLTSETEEKEGDV